jgi:ABC-2 type transport system permease protein
MRSSIEEARERQVKALAETKQSLDAFWQAPKQVPAWQDPRRAANLALWGITRVAAYEPAPMALLARGTSDLVLPVVIVSAGAANKLFGSDEVRNPEQSIVGHFDFAFVLCMLLPLCAIALTAPALSEERESGRFAILRAALPAVGALTWGKLAARLLLLAGLILVTTLAAFSLLPSDAWRGVLPWLGTSWLYAAFWIAVTLFLSSRLSSSGAWVSAAALYLILAVLVPGLSCALSEVWDPPPSRARFIEAARDASIEQTRQGSALLARYYEDHPELVPESGELGLNDFAKKQFAASEAIDA